MTLSDDGFGSVGALANDVDAWSGGGDFAPLKYWQPTL